MKHLRPIYRSYSHHTTLTVPIMFDGLHHSGLHIVSHSWSNDLSVLMDILLTPSLDSC